MNFVKIKNMKHDIKNMKFSEKIGNVKQNFNICSGYVRYARVPRVTIANQTQKKCYDF